MWKNQAVLLIPHPLYLTPDNPNFPASVLLLETNTTVIMKVEIWSDVMCPFCYIGKRRFEKALEQFDAKDKIDIVWKSFQLNPAMETDPSKNITEYLAEVKGWSIPQARQINQQVTDMAKAEGLQYDFDKAIVANSFNAHRLIQLAKVNGKGDAMEEALFKAYFTEGKNIDDQNTLTELAIEIGIAASEVQSIFAGSDYTEAVENDIYEAQQIGVRGVPYFVLNDKYAVSGAQASETFLGALQKAWGEYEKDKPALTNLGDSSNAACSIDGECN